MAKHGRLAKEMKMMAKKVRPGVFLQPKGDSLEEFEASITGVEGTPYESGLFKLEVKIPDNYPFGAPSVRFITPVYHPNVDSAGRICLKTLKLPPAGDWSPATMLVDLIAEIRMLLKCANPKDSLMPDVANEYMSNRAEFDKKAKEHTERHAKAQTAQLKTTEEKVTDEKENCGS